MHHEQDMRYYGALRKEIPITFWVMVIGTLAITGVGIDAGGIGFAGFWSKDAILENAWASGSVPGTIAFWLGALAALLTSFYSWRLIFLTFFGHAALGRIRAYPACAPRRASMRRTRSMATARTMRTRCWRPALAATTRTKARSTILVPIVLLALGALLAGQLFHGSSSMPKRAPNFWRGAISFSRAACRAAAGILGAGSSSRRRSSC